MNVSSGGLIAGLLGLVVAVMVIAKLFKPLVDAVKVSTGDTTVDSLLLIVPVVLVAIVLVAIVGYMKSR